MQRSLPAAALEEAWRGLRPSDTVERLDLLKFFSPLHKKIHADGYIKLVERAPELWGFVFKTTDDPKLARRLNRVKRILPSASRVRFARFVKKFQPDVVLCAHYAPLETLAKLKENTVRQSRAGVSPARRARQREHSENFSPTLSARAGETPALLLCQRRDGFRGARAVEGFVRGFVLRGGGGNEGAGQTEFSAGNLQASARAF